MRTDGDPGLLQYGVKLALASNSEDALPPNMSHRVDTRQVNDELDDEVEKVVSYSPQQSLSPKWDSHVRFYSSKTNQAWAPTFFTRWRWRQNTRLLGNKLNISNADDSYRDVIGGPLDSLWNATRVRTTKRHVDGLFTDAWILREFALQNEVNPSTLYAEHLEHLYAFSADHLAITCIDQSEDGSHVAVGTQGGSIHVYVVRSGHHLGIFDERPDAIFNSHVGPVRQIVFRDNMSLASIGIDKTMRLWQMDRPRPLEVMRTSDLASSVATHPQDASLLLLGCVDATVQIWKTREEEAGSRTTIVDYVRIPDVVTALKVSPSGQYLAVGLIRGRVVLYDATTLRFITEVDFQQSSRRWKRTEKKVVGIYWRGDGSFVLTLHDSTVRLVTLRPGSRSDLPDLEADTILKGHTLQHLLIPAQVCGDGTRIMAASEDNTLCCWSLSGQHNRCAKVRLHQELITAMVVGTKAFDNWLSREVHSATKVRMAGEAEGSRMWNVDLNNVGNIGCCSYPDLGMPADEIIVDKVKRLDDSDSSSEAVGWGSQPYINPDYQTAIVGCYDGTLKVFANFGLRSQSLDKL